MIDLNRAIWLQLFIEDHYGIDVANLSKAEVISLVNKLQEMKDFDLDELKPVEEYSNKEVEDSGFVS